MPELDEKKRIIAYDTVNDPDENYYALIDNGTAGTGKVSIKGLGPADMISDQYSDSSTYKVGDLCIHNNKLYVCTVAINTPHAFNLSEWELDTLGNYASEIKQSLSNLIKSRVISGTTTATGALALPNNISSDKIISCKYTIASGALGLVYPRGDGYVTCLASSLQPFSNTSVEVIIWYTSSEIN